MNLGLLCCLATCLFCSYYACFHSNHKGALWAGPLPGDSPYPPSPAVPFSEIRVLPGKKRGRLRRVIMAFKLRAQKGNEACNLFALSLKAGLRPQPHPRPLRVLWHANLRSQEMTVTTSLSHLGSPRPHLHPINTPAQRLESLLNIRPFPFTCTTS